MKHLFCLFVGCLVLSSCQEQVHLKGFYTAGWEWSQFEPCENLEEWWWVTGDTVFFNQYDSLRQTHGHDPYIGPYVYVEVRGNRSREGTYGHLDNYVREFEITQMLTMQYQKDLQMGQQAIKKSICAES